LHVQITLPFAISCKANLVAVSVSLN
jgi:hypothetical protein